MPHSDLVDPVGTAADEHADDQQLRERQYQPREGSEARLVTGIRHVEGCWVIGHRFERERWVPIRAQRAVRVVRNPPRPTKDSEVELEDRMWVAACDQDGE